MNDNEYTRKCVCGHTESNHAHPVLGAGHIKPNKCFYCKCPGFITSPSGRAMNFKMRKGFTEFSR